MIEVVASDEVGERLRVLIVWWRLRVFELYSNQKVGHKMLVVCGDCWSRTSDRPGQTGLRSYGRTQDA